ncbi:hypothetical protein KRR38_12335 [Novosphingobium sp. G106]|uniref:hypothetical protein n=1 Tax=Novosphingobium sp. G106 TaxID=2849500 RepID=UPI001C2D21B7|nr:hypothetical protein [Novosphingobium sp. G106]MBV1688441.1 hypothetical protein [Novosphingobium sp. G106]
MAKGKLSRAQAAVEDGSRKASTGDDAYWTTLQHSLVRSMHMDEHPEFAAKG